MKVYKFVFVVGLLNLTIPFLGFPLVFKQYAIVILGAFALLYALYVRAIVKEEEAGLIQRTESVPAYDEVQVKTIEQVVEMRERPARPRALKAVSDVTPKRRGRKPRAEAVTAHEDSYE